MVKSKPASRPIAKAMQVGDDWVAQYAAPGVIPAYIMDANGKRRHFPTEDEAHHAALEAMTSQLTSRLTTQKSAMGYRYAKPMEFEQLLHEHDIEHADFIHVFGCQEARFRKWLAGVEDIPHIAVVIAEIMTYEDGYETAMSIADGIPRDGVSPAMFKEALKASGMTPEAFGHVAAISKRRMEGLLTKDEPPPRRSQYVLARLMAAGFGDVAERVTEKMRTKE